MRTSILFTLLFGLWVATTTVDLSAQTENKRDSSRKAETTKPPAERGRKGAPKRTPEKKAPVVAPKSATDTQTWLGVATAPVPQSLRDYLEIETGFGVQIFKVLDDSPASKAGLKANDVLILFEEQRLISPEHLSLLVKRLKEGAKVDLTVIRKGAEKKIEVTLGATKLEAFSRSGGFGSNPHLRPPFSPGNPQSRHWEEAMRRQQDHFQKWIKDQDGRPKGSATARPEGKPAPGKPPAVSVRPGFPVKVLTAEGVIKIDNEKGELMITNKDGKHEMLLKAEDGSTIYEGKYDPEAGTESLPKAAQEHLKKMKLEDLKVLTPNAPKAKPENASQPLKRASLDRGKSQDLL